MSHPSIEQAEPEKPLPKICIVRSSDSDFSDIRNLLSRMFADAAASFYVGRQLAVRDLYSTYRQSILGFLWILLPPLVTTALWLGLNQAGIAKVYTAGLPYAIFLTAGTLLWTLFTDALNSPRSQVAANMATLGTVNFPPEAVLVSGLIQLLVNFGVRLSILIAMLFWFRCDISAWIPMYLAFAVIVIGLGLVAGMLIVPFAVLYRDVGQTIGLVLPLFMYVTPVVYSLPEQGILRWLMLLNPLTYPIEGARLSLFSYPGHLNLGICLGMIPLLLLGLLAVWMIFRITLPYLIERSSG